MELAIPPESLVISLSTNPPAVYSGKKLSRLIDGVAGRLHSLHLPPDVSIGIIGVNSVPLMIAMLGAHKTNHVCIPLNYKLPKDKIHFCIKDGNVGLVFCDAEFRHLVSEGISVVEFGNDFDHFVAHDHTLPTDLDPNRLCLALYTSGTTGVPKKIVFSFNDRFSEATRHKMMSFGVPKQKAMSANPLFHNAGINWFVSSLLRGNTIFVPSHFDSREFLKTIQKYQITSISLVPPMMSMMLNEIEILKTIDLSSVREIVFQAALADQSLIERVKEVFVNAMYIGNPYGLTETGLSVFGKHPDGIPIPNGSAGHPTPSVRIKLVDDVLYVKAEDMLSRIKDNGEEYFNTRDRFTVDAQGFYYYAGRADDMLKCGGEKVFPIEVETVLKQYPGVIDSIVIGLEDDVKGHKPYAFVKTSTSCNESELLNYAAANLASYQIPKRIWQLDNFPINEIGKIDKKNLKQLAEQYILDRG
jgi:acyl-CoA synthetase (AMP-forming)/AMP-acid ligase II